MIEILKKYPGYNEKVNEIINDAGVVGNERENALWQFQMILCSNAAIE